MPFRLIVSIAAAACLLLAGCGRSAHGVSLKFVRYGTHFLDGRIAYLRLTNASSQTYVFPMVQIDGAYTMRGPVLRLACQFQDLTPHGWTNWSQESLARTNALAGIAPHTEMELVIPIPANVQRRKVAALCQPNTLPLPLKFWTSPTGFQLMRFMPRSWVKRILVPPPLIKVWCDRELTASEGK